MLAYSNKLYILNIIGGICLYFGCLSCFASSIEDFEDYKKYGSIGFRPSVEPDFQQSKEKKSESLRWDPRRKMYYRETEDNYPEKNCVKLKETNNSATFNLCRISDIYHHKDPEFACLKELSLLSEKELSHFIEDHLNKKTHSVVFTNQVNLNDAHLEELAISQNASRIRFLNLTNTHITCKGIIYLWESLLLGSVRDDRDKEAIYKYRDKLVSTIKIEIGGTLASQQHKLFKENNMPCIFPLALKKDFEIQYLCSSGKHIKRKTGLKEIKIMINGELI